MGIVVDDPLDYYGGRLTQQERKATLTEQLLADAELTHTRKKRYGKLQVRPKVGARRGVEAGHRVDWRTTSWNCQIH